MAPETITRPNFDYDTDFYGWCLDQAAALRRASEARLNLAEPLDLANLAEEIESLGRSQERELGSRYKVLLMHLLKWRHQQEGRSVSWRATIRNQRWELARLLRQNPSLRRLRADEVADAYPPCREDAADETGLPVETFPATCPFTLEQIHDMDFWPEAA